MEICQFKVNLQKDILVLVFIVKMAEWLKRCTVSPLGCARVGPNPIFVVFLIGSVVKWIEIRSLNTAIKF